MLSQASIDRWLQEDPSMIAFLIRNEPEVAAKNLTSLAWALSNDPNCSRNDILGLLDLLKGEETP